MPNRGALNSATTGELVIAAQCGGADASRALEALVQSNEGLCRSIVARVAPGGDDDLMQIARIGITEAARRYRADRSSSFSTFAWNVVKARVQDEVRRRVREPALEAVPGAANEREDQGPDDIEATLNRIVVFAALEKMSRSDRDLLGRLYADDRPQTDVARELGVSHTAVYKRHRRLISFLKSEFDA